MTNRRSEEADHFIRRLRGFRSVWVTQRQKHLKRDETPQRIRYNNCTNEQKSNDARSRAALHAEFAFPFLRRIRLCSADDVSPSPRNSEGERQPECQHI